MNDHKIVGESEVFDHHAVSIEGCFGRRFEFGSHLVRVGQRDIGIAGAELAGTGHEAKLIDRPGVGAWSSEGCQVGDDRIRLPHQVGVGVENLAGSSLTPADRRWKAANNAR